MLAKDVPIVWLTAGSTVCPDPWPASVEPSPVLARAVVGFGAVSFPFGLAIRTVSVLVTVPSTTLAGQLWMSLKLWMPVCFVFRFYQKDPRWVFCVMFFIDGQDWGTASTVPLRILLLWFTLENVLIFRRPGSPLALKFIFISPSWV